jgi:hypothetical protein
VHVGILCGKFLVHTYNILELVLERPSKKEPKTIVDSKNLVEPLKPR